MRRKWKRWGVSLLLMGCTFWSTYAAEPASSTEMRTESVMNEEADPGALPQETILIYMVGSNLESKNGSATADLKEILNSGLNVREKRVLIFTGGALQWHSDIPNDRNTIQQVTEGEQGLILEKIWENESAMSMGDSAALTEFINYSTDKYPSENYSLIFWDHGSGPVQGFGYDELFEGDQLSLAEIQEALDQTIFGRERKLSWIGFDACLMASLEVAKAVEPYAEYMIASQEVEPGDGWDYSFLSEGVQNIPETASHIVDSYVSYYHQQEMVAEVTLSCVDLRKIPDLSDELGMLFSKMTEGLGRGTYPKLAKGRAGLRNFGETSSGGAEKGPDLVDLYTLAASLEEDYPTESSRVKKLLEDTVIYRSADIEEAMGLSVYYPYNNLDYYLSYGQKSLYKQLEQSQLGSQKQDSQSVPEKDTQQENAPYITYMTRFVEELQSGAGTAEWVSGNEKRTEQEYQMILTEEQRDMLSYAALSIWCVIPEEDSADNPGYMPLVQTSYLTPDQKGILRVNLDQKYYILAGDHGEKAILPVSQTGKERRKKIFSTSTLVAHVGNELSAIEEPSARITANFSTSLSGENPMMQRIFESGQKDSGILGNRMDVDLTEWSRVGSVLPAWVPTYGEDGRLLPISEWEIKDRTYVFGVPIDGQISVEEQSCLETTDMLLYGHIRCVDIYGNSYSSNLFSLNEQNVEFPKELSTNTEQGTMTWELHSDENTAVLTSYSGEDTDLVIPETVEGYQVTKIDGNAFRRGAKTLQKITIPRTVKRLETDTLMTWGDLETVLLPAEIEYLEPGVFGIGLPLKKIEFYDSENNISEEGLFYKISDDAVFSKDGKSLLAVLNGNTIRKYTVPEGVERIEDFAFWSIDFLTDIEFPETLESIGNYAFAGCDGLREIRLPDSLRRIGHRAFSMEGSYGLSGTGGNGIGVSLGKNLSFIGEGAFLEYPLEAFTVSEENLTYSSLDGLLVNKKGDTLLAFPRGRTGVYRMPEGITYLADGCLPQNSELEELILPDSLQRISDTIGGVMLPRHLQKLSIGKNLKNIPSFFLSDSTMDIQISEENPYLKMKEELLLSKDGTVLFWVLPKVSLQEVAVPEGVTTIVQISSTLREQIRKLSLPSTYTEIDETLFDDDWKKLEQIDVAEDNPKLSSQNGLLLSKDQTALIKCPSYRDTIEIPETVTTIRAKAIYGTLNVSELVIPEGVEVIREKNFYMNFGEKDATIDIWFPDSLREISAGTFNYNWVTYRIHAKEGSVGQMAAEYFGLEFIPVI
ncbi:MAG: clostripain-related cysteine peptidase [Eubacteriales bacterium]|nr:clostripain-related cysteine peptidase [Eubacteriales bacterium]